MRQIVNKSRWTFTEVSEIEICEAQRLVEQLEEVRPCFSESTAVAGLVKLARANEFPHHETTLINITGCDRENAKVPGRIQWLIRLGDEWVPEC